jgi:tRNA dimethylallyltransferase
MSYDEKIPYISILGPTASGKSSFALRLAKELNGEIISCDSVQLYKGFDIGSAKATKEEQREVKHHMIDLLGPGEEYDAAQYAKEAREVINDILARKKTPIVVGGTGLYYRFLVGDKIHALPSDEAIKKELEKLSDGDLYKKLLELDPKRAEKLHKNDRYRLVRALEIILSSEEEFSEQIKTEGLSPFIPKRCILLNPPRKILHERIEFRTRSMLKTGLIEEVKFLRSQFKITSKAMQTIGYKQVNQFLDGEIRDEEELFLRILYATRQYAKRQTTFFKKMIADEVLSD